MAQRHLVYVVFARTPGGDGAAEILLKVCLCPVFVSGPLRWFMR